MLSPGAASGQHSQHLSLLFFCRNMCLRNFRHFKKVNLKSAASLNYVCYFSKPRISLHWFVPMLTAKQHSHKRSRKCFGWRQIDLKESSKKTFFGVGMLCQTQFTPHWMLMQREHVSGLFSNHLYVPFQLSPEATSALTFCWALLAFCPKEVTIAF